MRNTRFKGLGLVAVLLIVLLATLLATGCGAVVAQGGGDYPNREIEFIVPLAAGSAPDTTFRKLSGIVEEDLGQNIVILNRPGGGGTVGTTEIVNANPEGYTIGMNAVAFLTLKPELINTPYQGPDSLQPIIQTNIAPVVLFVNTDSGIETIEDFVQRAKEESGSLSVGIPGEFSVLDLEVDVLQRQAGIEVEQVVYDAGKQVPAVVNGTIDAAVAQPPPVLQYVERGDLRIIGIFGEQKPEGIDAPLFTEAGYDITEVPYEFVVGPKEMPAERVQVIQDAYKAAMESEEFQEYVNQQKIIAEYLGPEELGQKLERDDQEYEEYIQELGWGTGTSQEVTEQAWKQPSLLVGASLLAVLAVTGAGYRYRVSNGRTFAFGSERGGESSSRQGEEEDADVEEAASWEPSPFVKLLLFAVLAVVGFSYLIRALSYPFGSLGGPDFGFFPVLVGVLLVGAAAVVLVRQGRVVLLRGATGEKEAEPAAGEASTEDAEAGGTAGFQSKLVLILATLLVYVLVADVIGHTVTAALVSAAALKLTGQERPWWQVFLFGVAIGVGSYLLFAVVLGMSLPTGVLSLNL